MARVQPALLGSSQTASVGRPLDVQAPSTMHSSSGSSWGVVVKVGGVDGVHDLGSVVSLPCPAPVSSTS